MINTMQLLSKLLGTQLCGRHLNLDRPGPKLGLPTQFNTAVMYGSLDVHITVSAILDHIIECWGVLARGLPAPRIRVPAGVAVVIVS
jgi:hypothetical protein